MARLRTPVDAFDLDNVIHQADLQDILDFELFPQERRIMMMRLGIETTHNNKLYSLLEVARIFKTNPDEIIGIESKVAKILRTLGVPLVDQKKKP